MGEARTICFPEEAKRRFEGLTLLWTESNFSSLIAGWSSLVARRAHNPKVAGSNPAPATLLERRPERRLACKVG